MLPNELLRRAGAGRLLKSQATPMLDLCPSPRPARAWLADSLLECARCGQIVPRFSRAAALSRMPDRAAAATEPCLRSPIARDYSRRPTRPNKKATTKATKGMTKQSQARHCAWEVNGTSDRPDRRRTIPLAGLLRRIGLADIERRLLGHPEVSGRWRVDDASSTPMRRSDGREADSHDDADRGRRVPGSRGPDEDRRGGFERGGWVAPYFDEEGGRSNVASGIGG